VKKVPKRPEKKWAKKNDKKRDSKEKGDNKLISINKVVLFLKFLTPEKKTKMGEASF